MGFDIHGCKPLGKSEESDSYNDERAAGIYFRNNCWWWRPLWEYICEHCSEFLSEKDMQSGGYNDGHKISATKAKKIAITIEALDMANEIQEFEDRYKKKLEALPQVPCNICEGTGNRKKAPQVGAGDQTCNGCRGTGAKDDWKTHYPFARGNVIQFAEFAKNSGGFRIY